MDFPALAQLKAAIGERLLRLGRIVIWMFQEWGCSPPQVLATFIFSNAPSIQNQILIVFEQIITFLYIP